MLGSQNFPIKPVFLCFMLILASTIGCAQQQPGPQGPVGPQGTVRSQESEGPQQQIDFIDPTDIFNKTTISNVLPEDGSKTKDTEITVSAVIETPSPEAKIVARMELWGESTLSGAETERTFQGSTKYVFNYTFDAEPDTYQARLYLDIYVGNSSSISGVWEEWEFGAGVRKTCQVIAYNESFSDEADPNDPTVEVIFNSLTLPLGEDWLIVPGSPELPSNFKWSRTSLSSDEDNDRDFVTLVYLPGADESQYEEMTYDVSITFSYHLTATGSWDEKAAAFVYCGAYQFEQDSMRPTSTLFNLNESVEAKSEIVTTLKESDTKTEEHRLTFKDCSGVRIEVKLETEHEGSGSSEATLTIERISLTRVD